MKKFVLLFCLILLPWSLGLASSGGVGNLAASGGGVGNVAASGGGVGNVAVFGGGGVGNIRTMAIPNTSMLIDFPTTWKVNSRSQEIAFSGPKSSNLMVARVSLKDITEPTFVDLKATVAKNFPDRKYESVEINGLQALRHDQKSAAEVKSDLYVLGADHEVVRVEATLKSSDDGIKTGTQIISTLRIKYQGKALSGQIDRYILLKNETYYSILGDCLPNNCVSGKSGSLILLREGEGGKNTLMVGTAGYDSGKILDLGAISYRGVRISGDFLEVPQTNVPLNEIYKTFSPQGPMRDLQQAELKKGHVYLLRTISWPNDDTLTKFKVTDIINGKYFITYKELAQVPSIDLQKSIDAMNKFTAEVEMPKNSGEVTLYSRESWGDYHSSSFNFKYGTRDNFYISHNRTHISYDEYGLRFHTRSVVGDFGGVIDLGANRSIEATSEVEFPSPMIFATETEVAPQAVVGHSYVIEHFDDEGFVFAAVKVLEIGPKNHWIRLAWRRLNIAPPYHFQSWLTNNFDSSVRQAKISLKKEYEGRGGEICFGCEYKSLTDYRGYEKQVSFYVGNKSRNADSIYNDNRSYRLDKSAGIILAPPGYNLNQITKDDFDKFSGRYERDTSLQVGGIYLGRLESYWETNLVAFEVLSITSSDVTIRYRTIYSGQVQPANQK